VWWIIFGIVHSGFATERVKIFFKEIIGESFRYYRLCYSIIAAVMVTYILYINFTIDTINLWHPPFVEKVFSAITGIAGLLVMLICIYKYFFYLSGIDVFFKQKAKEHLQVNGLNKYVRHPLYSSTILFAWSFFFWQPILSNLISVFIITIYTIIGAYFEERKLLGTFGDEYKKYISKVPMIIPRLTE
jgi:protein-S-isoprenylcysteine O-methyltransferase Ste14